MQPSPQRDIPLVFSVCRKSNQLACSTAAKQGISPRNDKIVHSGKGTTSEFTNAHPKLAVKCCSFISSLFPLKRKAESQINWIYSYISTGKSWQHTPLCLSFSNTKIPTILLYKETFPLLTCGFFCQKHGAFGAGVVGKFKLLVMPRVQGGTQGLHLWCFFPQLSILSSI